MIGIIVAAHAPLAEALVSTARLVVPQAETTRSVSVQAGDSSEDFEARLGEALAEFQDANGVLVLTDMFGGTPSQVSMMKHHTGKIEVITGTSLPMLIKALQLSTRDISLDEAASLIKESGNRAIVIASEVLGRTQSTGDGERA